MTYVGYHCFEDESGQTYGSFEVAYLEPLEGAGEPPNGTGWYWMACFPGCLPDGEPMGPFKSARSAYRDAMNS